MRTETARRPRTGVRVAIGTEVESALVVEAAHPAPVLRRLERLRAIGEWRLVARPVQTLEDDYLDTPDRRLAAARIALRVRRVNGAPRLAVKGPAPTRRGAAQARPELDVPWSTSAAGRVLRALADLGVPLARRAASRAWRGPEDLARALGLERVQRRETRREPRHVYSAEASGPALAELVLDTVSWKIGARRVRLAEIEIEAMRPEGRRVADQLPAALLEELGDSLRAWRPSKLATGLALEALEREGRLAPLVERGGWLAPRGLDLLARRLKPGA